MPILDQGYQHWQGQLAGHGWRWLAVARQGVRAGMQNRFVRRVLFASWVPALSLAAVLCLWGMVENPHSMAAELLRPVKFLRDLTADPKANRWAAWTLAFHVFLLSQMYFAMILVLLIGPGLISQDLRFNALPLYFSRPVRRIDYFLGKLGVIAFFVALVTVVPASAGWVLGVLFSLDIGVVPDTIRLLAAVIVYGLVVTVSVGLFMLALSSLTRNSRYVTVLWAGIWLTTLGVGHLLDKIHRDQIRRQAFSDPRAQIWIEFAAIERKLGRGPGGPNGPEVVHDEKERMRLLARRDALEKEGWEHQSDDWNRGQLAYEKAQESDWRPLLSYTGNLQRIGFALLGSRAAWDKVDELSGAARIPQGHPGGMNMRFNSGMSSEMVPRYPWYWSALVLVVLAAGSVWLLIRRVQSLDRLR